MRILVTGALGFIGSHLVDELVKQGHNVVGLDAHKIGSDIRNCNVRASYANIDLANYPVLSKYIQENNFNQVYHLASESHVDRAIEDASPFIESNITGTYNLFKAFVNKIEQNWGSPKYPFPKFLMFSTDEVMGEIERGSFKEQDPTLPKNLYSMTKQAQEAIARSYYYSDNFPIIISRCSNIYGPRQYPEKLLPVIIQQANYSNKIPVYGDGSNIREWTHCFDAVSAAIFIMNNGNLGEVYHIGSGIEKKNIDVVKYVLGQLGKDESYIEYVKDRKGHDKRYSIDASKLRNMGWKSKITFEDGIRSTIQWYQENPR